MRGGLRISLVHNRQRKVLIVASLIAISILIAVFSYYEFNHELKIQDYISDECWYVSAARNILRDYFHLVPSGQWDGYVRATIELNYPTTSQQYSEWINDVRTYLKAYGGRIVKDNGYYQFRQDSNYLPAVCIDLPPSNLSHLKSIPHELKYAIGYCYPNAKGILDYTNQEHPPLIKYFISASMLTLGDNPEFWRIPSIIAGGLILALIYFVFIRIYPSGIGGVLGLVAALLTAIDITFRSLSMVAMLDIFVALFTYLTYYYTLRGKLLASSLMLSFGFISKFSGLFPGFPALIEWLRREIPAKVLLYLVYTPLVVLLIAALPFIIKDGFWGWWSASVVGAIHWHLSIKTTGGPPQAMPWEWLIGKNPFVLHYTYNSVTGKWVPDLIASGNPVLYLLTLALSLYIIPHINKLPDKGTTYDFTIGTYLMYYVIYFLGSKTQYSFYSVQVVPLFYTLLIIEVYYFLERPSRALEIAKEWVKCFKFFMEWLAGNVSIKVNVVVKKQFSYLKEHAYKFYSAHLNGVVNYGKGVHTFFRGRRLEK